MTFGPGFHNCPRQGRGDKKADQSFHQNPSLDNSPFSSPCCLANLLQFIFRFFLLWFGICNPSSGGWVTDNFFHIFQNSPPTSQIITIVFKHSTSSSCLKFWSGHASLFVSSLIVCLGIGYLELIILVAPFNWWWAISGGYPSILCIIARPGWLIGG